MTAREALEFRGMQQAILEMGRRLFCLEHGLLPRKTPKPRVMTLPKVAEVKAHRAGQRKASRVIEGAIHWQCSRCCAWKPAGEFWKSSGTSNGLTDGCRVCERERNRRGNRERWRRRTKWEARHALLPGEKRLPVRLLEAVTRASLSNDAPKVDIAKVRAHLEARKLTKDPFVARC